MMEVKGNFIVQGSYIDIHDNEVVNLSVDKAEVKVNGKSIEIDKATKNETDETPLRNHIFQERIFNTNERLLRLRNTIAAAIDMGDATIMYGRPQEMRINPNAKNEWYYIVKAVEEAGVAKSFAVTHSSSNRW